MKPREGRRGIVLGGLLLAAPITLILILAVLSMLLVFFYFLVLLHNFYWSFSTALDIAVIVYVNWGLFRILRRHGARTLVGAFAALDEAAGPLPPVVLWGPFGEGGRRGHWRRPSWWQWAVAALVASGVVLYAAFPFARVYFRALQVHMWLGLILFFVYLRILHRLIFRLSGSKVIAWEFVAWPLFYELSSRTVSPLSLVSLFSLTVIPFYLLSRLLERTPADARKSALIWFAWLYGMLATLITGIFIVMDPLTLRFEFVQRPWHAYLGVYLALVTLACAPLYLRRRRNRPDLRSSTLFLGWLLIAALSILATQQLRAAKGRIQARHYAANTYGSPQYNRARQATPRRLAPEALNGSAECAPCHPVPFQQWEVSAHAYAVKNRPFQAIAKALIERHGLEFVRDCATCHEPALAFSDRLDLLVDPEYLKRSEGVSCRACHAIDWSAERNGIYRVQLPRADGVFTDVSARAKFMKLAVMEHVSDFTKPNIVSGQTCFGCHSLRAKRAGHWVVPLDNVTSFRKSSFALEKNLKCHDCHMPRIEKDDFSYSWRDHRLFGSHLLLDRMSFETQPETLAKLRKLTEANNDFLFAKLHTLDQVPAFMDETFKTYRFFNYLKGWRKVAHVKAANSGGAAFIARLEDVALERGADGPQLAFTVRLSNPALGHDFPSSLFANLVRVWTECTLTDRGGRVLLQTSYQADDYTRQLGRIEVADDGRPILPPESLDYNRLVNLKYILPDAGYADRYRVTTPPDAQWPLQLSLQLKYRRYDAPQLAGAGDPQTQGLPDFTLLDYRTAIERPAEARR